MADHIEVVPMIPRWRAPVLPALPVFLLSIGLAMAAETYTPAPDLLAAARREGKVILYAANFLDTEQEVAKRFKQRFGIDVEIIRAPTGQLITRVKTEAAANRLGADVIDISDRIEARRMIDVFAPYAPPNADDYPAATRTGDRVWPRSGNAWTISYNPMLVPEPPKSWQDLATPAFGKLGLGQTVVASGAAPWTRAMFERKVLGEDYWARQAALKPTLYPSQAPMVDAMIRGEIAVAPLVTNLAIPLARQGAPLKWLFGPEGVPATVFAAGIGRSAPHPNAAKLFLDWALSREGQELMVELGSFSALKNAPLPAGVTASIKTWLPSDEEHATLMRPWSEDWNRIYGYRQ
jgi:iron(III) transport system substrate-binding protein